MLLAVLSCGGIGDSRSHAPTPRTDASIAARTIASRLTLRAELNSGLFSAMPLTVLTAACAPALPPAPTSMVRKEMTIMCSSISPLYCVRIQEELLCSSISPADDGGTEPGQAGAGCSGSSGRAGGGVRRRGWADR